MIIVTRGWGGAAALALAGLSSGYLAFLDRNPSLAAVAFMCALACVCLLAWVSCRQIFGLIAACARGQSLEIARRLDRVLDGQMDRALRDMMTSAHSERRDVIQRWSSEISATLRERPVLPRLAAALSWHAVSVFAMLFLLLSLMAMSLAIDNCAGGICVAVYNHSCLPRSTDLGGFASTAVHFLYYQAAGLFDVAGEVHRPVTRGAQGLAAFTSVTWALFLAGAIGGKLTAVLLVQNSLTPAALIADAIAMMQRHTAAEEGELKFYAAG